MWYATLHVFLEFGLGRAPIQAYIFYSKCQYITKDVQGKDVHARVFPRCGSKLHYFFREFVQNCTNFLAILKKSRN